jgi:hypothetical protein
MTEVVNSIHVRRGKTNLELGRLRVANAVTAHVEHPGCRLRGF